MPSPGPRARPCEGFPSVSATGGRSASHGGAAPLSGTSGPSLRGVPVRLRDRGPVCIPRGCGAPLRDLGPVPARGSRPSPRPGAGLHPTGVRRPSPGPRARPCEGFPSVSATGGRSASHGGAAPLSGTSGPAPREGFPSVSATGGRPEPHRGAVPPGTSDPAPRRVPSVRRPRVPPPGTGPRHADRPAPRPGRVPASGLPVARGRTGRRATPAPLSASGGAACRDPGVIPCAVRPPEVCAGRGGWGVRS
ncbi:hypothetical protein STENM223S_05037 [Streptomyces tendae]